MGLSVHFTNHFGKDIKRCKKRNKDMAKLKFTIDLLSNEKPLTQQNKDHILVGNYIGARECHIEPNWLLIYVTDEQNITFTRTGTHSDLFK